MIVQCAWCKQFQGEKEPLDDPRMTHTICESCFEKQINFNVIEAAASIVLEKEKVQCR